MSVSQSSDVQDSGRGRRRRARGAQAAEATQAVAKDNFATRQIPHFDFLSQEQLHDILDQAEWLMEEIGLRWADHPGALERWKAAGADVRGDMVHLPRGLARELAKTCPSQFTQLARNPANNVKIGGNHAVFAAMYGAPFVHCLDEGRRYGNIKDFRRLVRVAHQLDGIHHLGHVICEPVDVPVNKRHLDMLNCMMQDSDKPMLGAITERVRAEDSVEMAKILFGAQTLDDNCVIMGNVNTNSPMLIDQVVANAIEVYCGQGQGIVVVPFILSGAMGPVTTAASVAQAVAEALSCAAFSQLVRPGAPFILGNFLSSMSLKTGAPTFGTPEPVMSNYAVGQIARFLGLPLRCGGGLTSSKVPDAQAAYESADSMHSTVLAGANFVLHSAGWMEGGLSMSFEKLVMDSDRNLGYAKMLGGFLTDDNALAAGAYREVEPAGHFLGSSHTMANYETAFYEPKSSDNKPFEQWEIEGSEDARVRAMKRFKDLEASYQKPPLEPAVAEALDAYVAKRKESMPDAWY